MERDKKGEGEREAGRRGRTEIVLDVVEVKFVPRHGLHQLLEGLLALSPDLCVPSPGNNPGETRRDGGGEADVGRGHKTAGW